MLLLSLVAQTALSLTVDATGPVRFGAPVPEAAIGRGLGVRGAPDIALQWRVLQPGPDRQTGRRFVEIALGGPGMTKGGQRALRVTVGGVGPCGEDGGVVCRRTMAQTEREGIAVTVTEWRFDDGSVDRRVRREVRAGELEVDGETFVVGESLTDDTPSLRARHARVGIAPAEWRRLGVLPPGGTLAADVRAHLRAVVQALVPLPGRRGRGDYARSGDVVTNLEFDTTLGFAQLGLACADADLLARGADCARHMLDHDLDSRSGLPFAHGPDHRHNQPEPGHTWIEGLLLTGCVFADDELIAGALSIARNLARRPPAPPASLRADRARDFGWPLLALEASLRFAEDGNVQRAADALAAEMIRRHDPAMGVIRFGEGVRRTGYEERHWLTGGILLPALRAYAARTGDARGKAIIKAGEATLQAACLRGREGIPIRGWIGPHGEEGSELRLRGVAEGFLALEGLADGALPRVLGRRQVREALLGVPRHDDPDLATTWSMVARCRWVLR